MINIGNGAQVQKRGGKKEMYLNREKSLFFHSARNIRSALEWICFLKSTQCRDAARCSLHKPKTTQLHPSPQLIMPYRSKIMIKDLYKTNGSKNTALYRWYPIFDLTPGYRDCTRPTEIYLNAGKALSRVNYFLLIIMHFLILYVYLSSITLKFMIFLLCKYTKQACIFKIYN